MRSFVDPFPGWNPDFRESYVINQAVVPANSTAVLLCQYQPGPQSVCYMRGFGQEALCGAFAEVAWHIALGGRIVQTFRYAQVGTFATPAPLTIPFVGGQGIALLVTTGANAWTLTGMLRIQEKSLDVLAPEKS